MHDLKKRMWQRYRSGKAAPPAWPRLPFLILAAALSGAATASPTPAMESASASASASTTAAAAASPALSAPAVGAAPAWRVPREFHVPQGSLPLPEPVSALPQALARAAGTVEDSRLADLRGGSETPWSNMRLNGTVGNNAATNVVTGANIITEGAFSNASGLPMVIQNSGANVLIQNATIVNLQIR